MAVPDFKPDTHPFIIESVLKARLLVENLSGNRLDVMNARSETHRVDPRLGSAIDASVEERLAGLEGQRREQMETLLLRGELFGAHLSQVGMVAEGSLQDPLERFVDDESLKYAADGYDQEKAREVLLEGIRAGFDIKIAVTEQSTE